MSNLIKILSLDGGGIRGVIPAVILTELEKLTQKPCAQLFDLIAGTSTGGILALGLTAPDESGKKPRYSAERLIQLYEKEGRRIFNRSLLKQVQSVGGLRDERYSSDGIEGVLQEYFGDIRLKDALTNVIIPSYEIEDRFPFFFKSKYAKDKPDYDFPMKQVARATAAAPTFFEPVKIASEIPERKYYTLVDGGLFANNPGACALVEAKKIYPEAKNFLVVSLGTGELTRPFRYDEARDWGKLEWLEPLLSSTFDGVSDTVNYQLKELLKEDYYCRFQVTLTVGNDDIDDATQENIDKLKGLTTNLINEKRDILKRLSEKLLE